MTKEETFTVECNVCRQQYDNWWGSTPCCGSIAYLVDENGETTKKVGLYSSVGTVLLDFGEEKEKTLVEDIDGVHHINIYSKGATEIGKWLSNFSYAPIQTEHGWFNSVEGYWYWLTRLNDRLRTLHGFSAKKLGKESEVIMERSDEEFKKKICDAIDLKLKTNPKWVAESVNLPLKHYYEYGGKRIEKQEYNWITEHIQKRVNQLKQYYDSK